MQRQFEAKFADEIAALEDALALEKNVRVCRYMPAASACIILMHSCQSLYLLLNTGIAARLGGSCTLAAYGRLCHDTKIWSTLHL